MLLLVISSSASAQYSLKIIPVDKDSAFVSQLFGLQYSFKSNNECATYIHGLLHLLQVKGFPTASIDSVEYGTDTAIATVFFGRMYKIGYINTKDIERQLLEHAGWNERNYTNKPLDMQQLQTLQSRMLDHLENNGHPFAKIQLDSLQLEGEQFSATLKVTRGPLYKIDSIRVYGDANISAAFLQHYLDIPAGGIYQKDKLQNIRKKLLELPYVQETQPWDLTMLGTGSLLNVYLKPKRSSQVNVLIGLLPPDDQSQAGKLRVTGEANINLRNAFGNGELIGLNWQQLQVRSPRLDLSFEQPYIFGMPFGVAGSFNLFKKDSSFVNLSLQLGLQYTLSTTQTGKIFIQSLATNLLTVDTNSIKNTKALPAERDVSSVSLGVDYEFNKTDYRLNPRKGWELNIIASAGTRKMRKNNVIVKLQDQDNFNYTSLYDTVPLNSYQFRIRLSGARYFQLGRQSALKTGLNAAWLQSPQVYRNELFQIGGYRLLRGFDEQSIYVSQYAVGTLEYRYLIGLNSFLFSFIDVGATANKSVGQNTRNNFVGGGLGLAFETKAGIFNISYAAGKRDDAAFNLRAAKIHLGYVSYF
ncbi:MAG TPA: BamA/TamA family outer membrane protein [Chitinophagaceae bacterium]|nr:BamA/TamA family outer membrane protein [Chitinophagaceae bacterium]